VGQGEAVLLAAREDRDRLVHVVAREAERAEQPPHLEHRRAAGHRLQALLHRVAAVEHFHLMLGEVPGDDVVPEDACAARGAQAPGEQLEQGRLARAVGSDQGDPLAPAQQQAQVAVQRGRARVAEGGLLEGDHLLAARRRGRELEVDAARLLGRAGLGRGLGLLGHPLQAAGACLGLTRLSGLGAETLDEPQGVVDLAVEVLLLRVLLLLAQLPQLAVPVVVALVQGQPPAEQLGHLGGQVVEQGAVVGDQDDRAAVRGEELLEPSHRLQIEVVGGLVEEQHVGVAQQEPGEGHALAPAAAQRRQRAGHLGLGEAEPAEHLLGAGGGIEAALGLVQRMEVAVPPGGLGVGGIVRAHRLHAMLDRPQLGLDAQQVRKRQQGLVEDRVAGARRHHLLGQVADGALLRAEDLSPIGELLAEDQPQ